RAGRRVPAVHALGARDGRAEDPRDLGLHGARDRRPGWLRLSLRHPRTLSRAPLASRGRHLVAHALPRFARVFDRALVLDRRDVARVLVEYHGPQDAPHDLPAARLWEQVDEIQLADHGEGSEVG